MSIINDALKKARREGGPGNGTMHGEDDTVIRPRQQASRPPGIFTVLPALLMVVLFLALAGGLGYFLYKEYLAEDPAAETSPPAVETASVDDEPEAEPKVIAPPPEPEATAIESGKGLLIVSPVEEEAQPSDPVDLPTASPPPELSEFQINGVMRGGSSVRVITNSGVYQIGDTVSAPAGYILEAIGESELTLRSPAGESYLIPLP